MAKVQKTGKRVYNINSPEKLDAIKAAIIAGDSTRSIHEKFGTSIVNIHYHKAQLRKSGLLKDTKKNTGKKVPVVRAAKQAVPVKKVVKAPKTVKSVPAKVVKTAVAPKKAATQNLATGKGGPVNIMINGTKVTVDKAKAIKVNKQSILIEF